MDNNGLLRILHLAAEARAFKLSSVSASVWQWNGVAVIRPEFKCSYCGEYLRANAIFICDPHTNKLLGQLIVTNRGRAVVDLPMHPHLLATNGYLCLGSARDAVTLLNNPPYMRGLSFTPWSWFKKYFEHYCTKAPDNAALTESTDT